MKPYTIYHPLSVPIKVNIDQSKLLSLSLEQKTIEEQLIDALRFVQWMQMRGISTRIINAMIRSEDLAIIETLEMMAKKRELPEVCKNCSKSYRNKVGTVYCHHAIGNPEDCPLVR